MSKYRLLQRVKFVDERPKSLSEGLKSRGESVSTKARGIKKPGHHGLSNTGDGKDSGFYQAGIYLQSLAPNHNVISGFFSDTNNQNIIIAKGKPRPASKKSGVRPGQSPRVLSTKAIREFIGWLKKETKLAKGTERIIRRILRGRKFKSLKEKDGLLKTIEGVVQNTKGEARVRGLKTLRDILREKKFEVGMIPVVGRIAEKTKGEETANALSIFWALLREKKFEAGMISLLARVVEKAQRKEITHLLIGLWGLIWNPKFEAGLLVSFEKVVGHIVQNTEGRERESALWYLGELLVKYSKFEADMLPIVERIVEKSKGSKTWMTLLMLTKLLREPKFESSMMPMVGRIAEKTKGKATPSLEAFKRLLRNPKFEAGMLKRFEQTIGYLAEKTGGETTDVALGALKELVENKKFEVGMLKSLEKIVGYIVENTRGEVTEDTLWMFSRLLRKPSIEVSILEGFEKTVKQIVRNTRGEARKYSLSALESLVGDPDLKASKLERFDKTVGWIVQNTKYVIREHALRVLVNLMVKQKFEIGMLERFEKIVKHIMQDKEIDKGLLWLLGDMLGFSSEFEASNLLVVERIMERSKGKDVDRAIVALCWGLVLKPKFEKGMVPVVEGIVEKTKDHEIWFTLIKLCDLISNPKFEMGMIPLVGRIVHENKGMEIRKALKQFEKALKEGKVVVPKLELKQKDVEKKISKPVPALSAREIKGFIAELKKKTGLLLGAEREVQSILGRRKFRSPQEKKHLLQMIEGLAHRTGGRETVYALGALRKFLKNPRLEEVMLNRFEKIMGQVMQNAREPQYTLLHLGEVLKNPKFEAGMMPVVEKIVKRAGPQVEHAFFALMKSLKETNFEADMMSVVWDIVNKTKKLEMAYALSALMELARKSGFGKDTLMSFEKAVGSIVQSTGWKETEYALGAMAELIENYKFEVGMMPAVGDIIYKLEGERPRQSLGALVGLLNNPKFKRGMLEGFGRTVRHIVKVSEKWQIEHELRWLDKLLRKTRFEADMMPLVEGMVRKTKGIETWNMLVALVYLLDSLGFNRGMLARFERTVGYIVQKNKGREGGHAMRAICDLVRNPGFETGMLEGFERVLGKIVKNTKDQETLRAITELGTLMHYQKFDADTMPLVEQIAEKTEGKETVKALEEFCYLLADKRFKISMMPKVARIVKEEDGDDISEELSKLRESLKKQK